MATFLDTIQRNGFAGLVGPEPATITPLREMGRFAKKRGAYLADKVSYPFLGLPRDLQSAGSKFGAYLSTPQINEEFVGPQNALQNLEQVKEVAAGAVAPSPEEQALVQQQAVAKADQQKQEKVAKTQNALAQAAAPKSDTPLIEPPKEEGDSADLSKAMLRAGIAMLQSDGDVWDALGAGFGGYQDTLENEKLKRSEAADKARQEELEMYKLGLYEKQVMFPYWKAQNGGDAGGSGGPSIKDALNIRKAQLQELKFAQDQLEFVMEQLQDPMLAPQQKVPLMRQKQQLEQMVGLGGAGPGDLNSFLKQKATE